MSESTIKKNTLITPARIASLERMLHPACALIEYCAELQHGEIEILKIKDGLPVLAEVVRRKVKFSPLRRKLNFNSKHFRLTEKIGGRPNGLSIRPGGLIFYA